MIVIGLTFGQPVLCNGALRVLGVAEWVSARGTVVSGGSGVALDLTAVL